MLRDEWRSASTPPALEQRPCAAGDRIRRWQRYAGDPPDRGVMDPGLGAAMVGALAARIGADDQQIRARALALRRAPGRDHDDITRAQLDALPAFAAEPHPRRSRRDAEHLMRRAVIVVVPVDAVPPGTGPAVPVEHALARAGAVALVLQRAAIEDERQRIVRHSAVIGQMVGLDLQPVCRLAHPRPPAPAACDNT